MATGINIGHIGQVISEKPQKGVSPIIYNYFSPVPAAGEAFVADAFVLAWDEGSMAGDLVACVLLS